MFYAFKSVKWHDFIYLVTGYFIMMRLELLGILLSFILLTSGLGYDVNYAEARLPTDPCLQQDFEEGLTLWVKISYNEETRKHICQKTWDYFPDITESACNAGKYVNYCKVPEICGSEAGRVETDPNCKPELKPVPLPPTPAEEQASTQSKPAEPESELPASSVPYIVPKWGKPCSDTSPNSFLKISNDPWECERVNYWVPEKCGIVEGLYKHSASCQPTPEADPNQELIPWWAWPIIVIVCFIIVWGESNRRSREGSGPIWGYFYPKNSNFRDGPRFTPPSRWRDED